MAIPDFKEDVVVDPYPRYERLRRECPVPRVAEAAGLQALSRRLPVLELDAAGDLEHRPSAIMRGLSALSIRSKATRTRNRVRRAVAVTDRGRDGE